MRVLAAKVMDETRQAKRNTLSCPRDGCDFTTPRPDHMELHELRHQGIRAYSCYLDGCPYKAYTASALKTHEMRHRGEKLQVCDICRRAFTDTSTRDRHRRRKHPGATRAKKAKKIRPLLSCDVDQCPYTTRRPDQMDLHKKRHRGEKTFSCDTCPYRAFTKSDLAVHQRTHLDKKPFVCDFEGCEYACSQPGNLIIHKKTHTKETTREPSEHATEGVGLHGRLRDHHQRQSWPVSDGHPATLLKTGLQDSQLRQCHMHR